MREVQDPAWCAVCRQPITVDTRRRKWVHPDGRVTAPDKPIDLDARQRSGHHRARPWKSLSGKRMRPL